MFRRQISEKTTSTISIVWSFTTKSDGICVFRPLYTITTVRDVDSPFIVSYAVFAQATDAATLSPMLARTEHLTGHRLQAV